MKVKINTRIKSSVGITEESIFGIFDQNKGIIKYTEKDKTKVTLDMNNNIIKRKTNELEVYLDFNKVNESIITININNNVTTAKLGIKTNFIKKGNNYYNVDYTIEGNDDFIYTLKYKNINS